MSGEAAAAPGFGRAGALAGVALVLAVLGGLLWSASASPANSAERPRLFGGSLVLEDQRQLTVIDVATGAVVAGLQSVNTQVGAPAEGEVQAVPVSTGTMLIDRNKGTFNELDQDNYVIDSAGAGVGLGPLRGLTGASGLAAGNAAYIVRYAPRSTVSLVDESTVATAAKLERPGGAGSGTNRGPAVTPLGFAALRGRVSNQSGSAAVSGRDLWALVEARSSCQVTQLHPVVTGRNGLTAARRATLPTRCQSAAAEAVQGAVGVAWPGRVRVFPLDSHNNRVGRQTDVSVPGTRLDTRFLPVGGATGTLWYLAGGANGPAGWSVFGVSPSGKVTGPSPLSRFGRNAEPAPPVESKGALYTLDRASRAQPTLWTILPATGAMIPVQGEATYPARAATEKATFSNAEVVVDGPRVVFNNPGSLLAVVVFTDRTHAPVVVDKSSAVTVSTVGPTVAGTPAARPPGRGTSTSRSTAQPPPTAAASTPLVQPVNPAVTCAATTQKPYAPLITSVQPSSGSALVAWSYQLLDQGDCEPDTWAVSVKALGSSHQPAEPVQIVNGQTQLQFSGLRPATTYQVVVTAYINTQSTPSTPATFTTATRGPDAPTRVRTASDGRGDWIVSWAACAPASCLVPASTWNVVGATCGSSFVGQPPAIQVPAGQNTVTINADSLGLLGDSLSFSVQGVLASGLTGDPTRDQACTQAWRPPNAAAIRLAAAGAPSPDGQHITATLEVSAVGSSPVAAFGSNSTEFVYRVGGQTVGPTPSTRVTVPALAGGTSYTVTVSVYPAGHPNAAVVVSGQLASTKLQWPANLGIAVSPSVNPANPNVGSVGVSIRNLPAGHMSAAPTIQCGSTQPPVQPTPTSGSFSVPIDLVQFGSSCSLALTLSDTDTPNPYGGITWQSPAISFSFGTPPVYAFADQFSALCQQHFCPPGQQQIQILFSGPGSAPTRGGEWTIEVDGDRGDCAAIPVSGAASVSFPYPITLPFGCRHATSVSVTVSYEYLGETVTLPPLSPPAGTPGTTTTTTTTVPPTTTTTTTLPPSTTAPPSTTSPATTSPTTAAAAAAIRSAQSANLIAAEAPLGGTRQAQAMAGDPEVRTALEWGLLSAGAAAAWGAGTGWRAARRSKRRSERN